MLFTFWLKTMMAREMIFLAEIKKFTIKATLEFSLKWRDDWFQLKHSFET